MLKRASIKVRLMLLLGFAVLNVIAVGGISIYYLNSVVGTYGHLATVNMPALREVNEARNAQRSIVILTSSIAASEHAYARADQAADEFDEAVKAYDSATEEYQKIRADRQELEIRRAVDRGWHDFVEASQKMVDLAGATSSTELAQRASISAHELADARKSFRDSFAELTRFHENEAKRWSLDAQKSAETAGYVLMIATLVGAAVVLLLGVRMSTGLSKALESISEKILSASNSTTEATQEVSVSSRQLASSSNQQASSIHQTASAMEQISAMVGKNASSAESARSVSLDSHKKAISGQEAVMEMVRSIEQISQSNGEIAKQIESSNREMTEITNVIADIESKTKVINDIVFQTKLLSFNASVEAARAGEHGKGFAVVAEEVGNLAQMSGNASHSITEILQNGTKRVKEIIESSSAKTGHLMSDNQKKVRLGVEIAERCRLVLEGLVGDVTEVSEMASSIAVASQEQSHGVSEVNSAVSLLGNAVNETSTSSQSLSAAAQSLLHQTETMDSVVKELTAVIRGAA